MENRPSMDLMRVSLHLLQASLTALLLLPVVYPALRVPCSLRLLFLQQTALSVASLSLCRPGFMAICMALHAAADAAAADGTSQPSIPSAPDVTRARAAPEEASLSSMRTNTGSDRNTIAMQLSASLRSPVCGECILRLLTSTRRHFNINYRGKGEWDEMR